MCKINMMEIMLDNMIITLEYNSVLIIDNKEVIKNTIYLFNRSQNEYIQVYDNGIDELQIYKTYKEIPNNICQRKEYLMKALPYLINVVE